MAGRTGRSLLRWCRFKVKVNAVIVCICLLITAYAVMFVAKSPTRRQKISLSNKAVTKRENGTKLIFLSEFPWFYEFKMGAEHFRRCQYRCTFTDNAEEFSESDAVIFYSHHHGASTPEKSAGQIWIYFAVESPLNSGNEKFGSSKWRQKINWTMTYRFDSDIRFGYGRFDEKKQATGKDYFGLAKQKKKLIAWFVSNCATQSQRMKYVKMLQKLVPVDIYGNCGPLKCGKQGDKSCLDMLEKDYKFYLSFENSICKDYASEKFYRTLKLDIVPIVRGGSQYKDTMPFKGAIDTADFSTVRDLAEYLKFLDTHDEEYVKYLTWKDSYSVEEPMTFPFCDLCERVHNSSRWQRVYENVNDWWVKGMCYEPKDLN